MNAVFLELQIEIGVGESTGAPMFERNGFPGKRRKLGAKFTAPGSILESLVLPRAGLDWRDVLPGLLVAGTIAMMWCNEHSQLGCPRCL
jgi:hypothetical protein